MTPIFFFILQLVRFKVAYRNQLPRLSGSALNVSLGGGCGVVQVNTLSLLTRVEFSLVGLGCDNTFNLL